jgi:hypothetical protein
VSEIAEIGVVITADTKAVDAAFAKVEARGKNTRPVVIPVDADTAKAQASLKGAEEKTLGLYQARARFLAQSGDLAGAERLLSGALDATTATTANEKVHVGNRASLDCRHVTCSP